MSIKALREKFCKPIAMKPRLAGLAGLALAGGAIPNCENDSSNEAGSKKHNKNNNISSKLDSYVASCYFSNRRVANANPANRNHVGGDQNPVGGVIATAISANQNSSNGVTTKNPVGDLAGAANDQEVNSSSGVIPEFPDTSTRVCESGGNAPLEWFVGYAALRAMPTPSGFTREEWPQLKNDVGLFLEHWGGRRRLWVGTPLACLVFIRRPR